MVVKVVWETVGDKHGDVQIRPLVTSDNLYNTVHL